MYGRARNPHTTEQVDAAGRGRSFGGLAQQSECRTPAGWQALLEISCLPLNGRRISGM